MKYFFTYCLIECLILVPGFGAMAQENIKKQEINVEVEGDQAGKVYHVKVVTEKNGRQHVIEKSYGNIQEMESDSAVFRHQADSDDVSIIHNYTVKITDGDDQVTEDQDFEKKVFVLSEQDGDFVIHSENSGIVSEEELKNTFSGESRNIEAKIDEISLNDNEFSDFRLDNLRQLRLKSLHYFPNPNEGEFNLAFSGPGKPVIVRILDLGGNLKFEDDINNFKGNYNRMINIKKFEPGAYLLQVHQQGKVLNRKIIVK